MVRMGGMKKYIVIDIGCHECGVNSEFYAVCDSEGEAEEKVDECDKKTGRWRDGGQTYAQYFEINV